MSEAEGEEAAQRKWRDASTRLATETHPLASSAQVAELADLVQKAKRRKSDLRADEAADALSSCSCESLCLTSWEQSAALRPSEEESAESAPRPACVAKGEERRPLVQRAAAGADYISSMPTRLTSDMVRDVRSRGS